MSGHLSEEIDAAIVANEAIMLRAASNKTIMIVEGPTDHRFFYNYIDHRACDIVIAYGMENALSALEILKSRTMPGILCIVDSDFSHFRPLIEDPDVIRTDFHDIETIMFVSPAFDKVLSEYGSETKIANLRSSGTDPREMIRRAAHPLGIIRHYSHVMALGFKFEGIGSSHIHRQTLSVDIDELVAQVLRRSRRPPEGSVQIVQHVEYWRNKPHHHWHMCCGHDLIEAFGRALQSALGTQNSGATSREALERALRLAFSGDDFQVTILYFRIRDWELRNQPYRCLRQ